MKILAIETSCDETACAVVEDGRRVLCSAIFSQIPDHRLYGGVVPEIASRAHCEQIVAVTSSALEEAGITLPELDAVAVTYAPGLVGALLVGVSFAKGLCITLNKPLIPVHHIRGHIAACYLAHPALKPPFLCLVVSGGHSHILEVRNYTDFKVVGKTRDDAAGEAFDKAARVLGLPYPGGVEMDKLAATSATGKYRLPNPKVEGHPFDLSFSGLKTAVVNLAHNAEQKGEELDKAALAADFSERVADMLSSRLFVAAAQLGYKTVACAGGVSANSQLRDRLERDAAAAGLSLYLPPLHLCVDNAAMIGAQAFYEYRAGNVADYSLNAVASLGIDGVE
ncbi:MAG: tRNA (adenosine(37)-N6)-threonylcarbamoyltransferase complex transferase subunit TsaD [Oscillospiraceae bacterium]|nr:tRNA (adenosine(37)-N6)-threonylcarbamoyltransferase complex transferase subunit TsaD [Oscillospiraceae bacterium]